MIHAHESSIEANGRAYRLARFELRYREQLADWANRRLPGPVQAVIESLKTVPKEYHAALISEAVAQAGKKRSIFDRMVLDELNTDAGIEYTAAFLLRQAHPELTEKDATAVIQEYLKDHAHLDLLNLVTECEGKKNNDTPGGTGDGADRGGSSPPAGA